MAYYLITVLIAVQHNQCILYTLFWRHVWTKSVYLQANNIKLMKSTLHSRIERY